MELKKKLLDIYEHKYKLLMLIPLTLVLLSLLQIGWQTYSTGDFVNKGVALKGGSTITINQEVDFAPEELESFLKQKLPQFDISVRTLTVAGQTVGLSIDSAAQDKKEIDTLVKVVSEKIDFDQAKYSVEVFGSALGSSFFKQAFLALIFSFILMAIVVILYFRMLIPSLMVISCAFSDIVVTLGIFNLTGIKLSMGGVAAFLMLIGYSIDTDILLTSRVFKRKEGLVMERIYGAIKTGLTMLNTTIVAVLVALIFVKSDVIRQIMLIVFIGLLVDMVMTWIQNVGLIRLYLEKKKIELK